MSMPERLGFSAYLPSDSQSRHRLGHPGMLLLRLSEVAPVLFLIQNGGALLLREDFEEK